MILRSARKPGLARIAAVGVLAAVAGLLLLARWLTPDVAGLGTHEQLGLGRCSLLAATGYPCPTCGMTTAFAHAARGQMLASFRSHPAGLAFAAGVLVAATLAAYTLTTARLATVNWYRLRPAIPAALLLGLVLAGWAYKLAAGIISGQFPWPAILPAAA